jgi:hypothetical protein
MFKMHLNARMRWNNFYLEYSKILCLELRGVANNIFEIQPNIDLLVNCLSGMELFRGFWCRCRVENEVSDCCGNFIRNISNVIPLEFELKDTTISDTLIIIAAEFSDFNTYNPTSSSVFIPQL